MNDIKAQNIQFHIANQLTPPLYYEYRSTQGLWI